MRYGKPACAELANCAEDHPMAPSPRVWILDPYHTGSHAHWAKGVRDVLNHAGWPCELHTLPGRHWKWRMHGAAASWALSLGRTTPAAKVPDVVVTTDMCDVAQLRGLLPPTWHRVKFVVYFHENQLTFPWSDEDRDVDVGRNNTYAYLNLTSALAADAVWFNSQHHLEVFLEAAAAFSSRLPKPRLADLPHHLLPKCTVLPIGLNRARHPAPSVSDRPSNAPPIVLWNHRWSRDKGTDVFAAFAREVVAKRVPAQFVVLGASFSRMPDEWQNLQQDLGEHCLHWGYVAQEEDYLKWLWRADVLPVHPRQEYFGISVLEAMRCGTIPWVDEAHAYSETMPPGHRFVKPEDWVSLLTHWPTTAWPLPPSAYTKHAEAYEWDNLAATYVNALLKVWTAPPTPLR